MASCVSRLSLSAVSRSFLMRWARISMTLPMRGSATRFIST
jgi:hypothetical protein